MLGFLRSIIPQHSFVRRWFSTLNALLATLWFRFPARQLTVIGVTGTDGKTTTTEMIAHILRASGKSVVSFSTAQHKLGDNVIASDKRTTPNPWRLQSLLRQAVKQKLEYAVLEVSSHAIAQRRIFGIRFDVAVFTNLSSEHIDYHKTMEKYADTKKRLFTRLLKESGTAILNHDSEYGKMWEKDCADCQRKVVTFSLHAESRADRIGSGIAQREGGIGFFVKSASGDSVGKVFLPMFGNFNVENALAAITAAEQVGVDFATAAQALAHFAGVSGRMERVSVGQDFSVFVDFAVTPGALAKLLHSAREMVEDKRVIVVFGGTGNHPDVQAREQLGKNAAKHADVIIITDDEPYHEAPETIREQILSGVYFELGAETDSHKTVSEIPDRKTAIETALQMAASGDIILVTGMGHLNTRNIGGEEVEWNDKEVIKSLLRIFAE